MGTPVGSPIFPPGQYTHCVDRSAYVPAQDPTADFSSWFDAGKAAVAEFLLCEYLLGGKLVCLAGGGDVCAIGQVIGIEEVGYQKSGFDAIDNDFSFNILPFPYKPEDFIPMLSNAFAREPHKVRDLIVDRSPVGRLMVDPLTAGPPLPTPLEPKTPPHGTSPNDGYGVLYRSDGVNLNYDHELQNNLNKLLDVTKFNPSAIGLPIIHCECEGSRIFFVCQALKPFLELMQLKPPGGLPSPGEVCHGVLDWVPFGIGKAICTILEDIVALAVGLALAPAIAAAFASAWEAAQIFDDLFVTGPVSGQIHVGDVVVVHGRWTWDAGHAGHTELHPVKSIQKVELPDVLTGPIDPMIVLLGDVATEAANFEKRWCRLVNEAPPPPDPHHSDRELSPPQVASLNPHQKKTHDNQQHPEHQWTWHPLIDGCAPWEE